MCSAGKWWWARTLFIVRRIDEAVRSRAWATGGMTATTSIATSRPRRARAATRMGLSLGAGAPDHGAPELLSTTDRGLRMHSLAHAAGAIRREVRDPMRVPRRGSHQKSVLGLISYFLYMGPLDGGPAPPNPAAKWRPTAHAGPSPPPRPPHPRPPARRLWPPDRPAARAGARRADPDR